MVEEEVGQSPTAWPLEVRAATLNYLSLVYTQPAPRLLAHFGFLMKSRCPGQARVRLLHRRGLRCRWPAAPGAQAPSRRDLRPSTPRALPPRHQGQAIQLA